MKTKITDSDPEVWLASLPDRNRASDAARVMNMMADITQLPPAMWGDSMIGFGSYTYKRADGSSHSFFRTGLSPRKTCLTIYLMPGVATYANLLADLGPHKHSVSCLYITRLARIDEQVLQNVIRAAFEDMNRKYPDTP